MARAGIEALLAGTNLLADGYGLGDGGELRGEEKNLLDGVRKTGGRLKLKEK
jgi:hypothetical protein